MQGGCGHRSQGDPLELERNVIGKPFDLLDRDGGYAAGDDGRRLIGYLDRQVIDGHRFARHAQGLQRLEADHRGQLVFRDRREIQLPQFRFAPADRHQQFGLGLRRPQR